MQSMRASIVKNQDDAVQTKVKTKELKCASAARQQSRLLHVITREEKVGCGKTKLPYPTVGITWQHDDQKRCDGMGQGKLAPTKQAERNACAENAIQQSR